VTTTHASAPAPSFAFRFTRSDAGYAVGYLPTLDSIAAGSASSTDGRHLGRVVKVEGTWTAIVPSGYALGEQYRTRAEAATALLVTSDRIAALDALPTDDEPTGITTRPVGAGLDEVALDGQAIGRTRDLDAGSASTALVDAYTTTGTRIGEALTRDAAHALLVEHADPAAGMLPAEQDDEEPVDDSEPSDPYRPQTAHLMGDDLLAACGSLGGIEGLYVVPSSTPERITCCRCLLLAVEVEVRRLGYRNAAHYLQAPGREDVRARVEQAAQNPDGPDLPRYVDAPAVVDPAEQVAEAILDRRPALLALRPGVDPERVVAELDERPLDADERALLSAGVDLARDRLAARYGVTPEQVTSTAREVVEEALGSEVDDPREQPEPLEWSSHAGR